AAGIEMSTALKLFGVVVPVELRRRYRSVGEPIERDVVEHLILGEGPLGLSPAICPGSKLVIKRRQPGRQANRSARSPVFAGGSPSWRHSPCSSYRRCPLI